MKSLLDIPFVEKIKYISSLRPEETAILIIDMQNDFISGSLRIQDAETIMNPVATFQDKAWIMGYYIILTQDWHPKNHESFASSHLKAKPFDKIQGIKGLDTLWPDHCIQGTIGAKFYEKINIDKCHLILRKGFNINVDSYSAFKENDGSGTGLNSLLLERGMKNIVLLGLATDFCVFYSAMDALEGGFSTYLLSRLTKPVDNELANNRLKEFLDKGGFILN